jgi:hypothetical protein
MSAPSIPSTPRSRPLCPNAEVRDLSAIFRGSEYLLILYFLLCAARTAARSSFGFSVGALSVPASLWTLAEIERRKPRKWVSVLRDWAPIPFVLLAYLSADWILRGVETHGYERQWIVWDRFLLEGWGLHSAIEYFGPVLPSLLELCYLILYGIPPILVAVIFSADAALRWIGFSS